MAETNQMYRRKYLKLGLYGPAMTCLIFKLFAVVFLLSCLVHVFYYVYMLHSNAKGRIKIRSLEKSSYHDNCELNKKMLTELQSQMNEKDYLLKSRDRVIEALTARLAEYNDTHTKLTSTFKNLTDVLRFNKIFPTRVSKEDTILNPVIVNSTPHEPTPTRKHSTMPFPEHLKDNVDKVSRPCCMALKRMTDILRLYMEKSETLRDEIEYYRHLNITDFINHLQEKQFGDEILPYNCSVSFYQENINLTKNPAKHSIYQTYQNDFFYESMILNRELPKQKVKSKTSHRTIDFTNAKNIGLKELVKQKKLSKDLLQIDEAIIRYDELSGAEYKMAFKYNDSRTFLVHIIKPYGIHILASKIAEHKIHAKELINIIVPITGRTAQLSNFLRDIGSAVISKGEHIFLTIVIYGKDPENKIKTTIRDFSKKHNFGNYDVFKKDLPFSRGRALHDGIMRWNGDKNVLLFLCDIDIKFNYPFLQRCRKYAEPGKSVYMPIVFSLYNPNIVFGPDKVRLSIDALNISEHTGTWRPLGYGMVCTYKLDYLKTKGFNLNINGWGGEDVSLYHRFRKKGLKVIRAPDPDLYHIWHPKYCSTKLSKRQYETCVGSKARYEGSQRQLGIILFSKHMAMGKTNKITTEKTGN